MDYVKIRTVVKDHQRFIGAGESACALWAWAMLYAGEHETDGHVPRIAVLKCAWLSGHAKALRAAYKLVEVGLWTAVDGGYSIVGWEKQGNKTRAQLDADRLSARARMKNRRLLGELPALANSSVGSPDVLPNIAECSREQHANIFRTSVDVPSSLSSSLSGFGSLQTKIPPAGGDPCPPPTAPPPWFSVDMLGILAMNAADVFARFGDVGERWVQYGGAIARGRGANAQEAASWFTARIRAERAEADKPGPRSGRRLVQDMPGAAFEIPAGLR